ncbi:MAG: FAD-dependent oxidoreductase, partial [Caldimonas sp.]
GAVLASGLLPVLSFDGGYGGMVVADDGLATLACCIRRDRLDAARRDAPGQRAGDVVEALLRTECQGVRDALQGATREGAWLASGPLDPGVHLGADDGVFRVGNAAGEAHPIIGEGMSMALQSAWLLCAHLLGPEGDAGVPEPALQRHLLRRYEIEWRRQFRPRLRLAATFAHAAMRPAPARLLFALASAWPGLLTRGAEWGGKTRCAADAATIARLASGPAAQHADRSCANPLSHAA